MIPLYIPKLNYGRMQLPRSFDPLPCTSALELYPTPVTFPAFHLHQTTSLSVYRQAPLLGNLRSQGLDVSGSKEGWTCPRSLFTIFCCSFFVSWLDHSGPVREMTLYKLRTSDPAEVRPCQRVASPHADRHSHHGGRCPSVAQKLDR
jgi:hypothetical protein